MLINPYKKANLLNQKNVSGSQVLICISRSTYKSSREGIELMQTWLLWHMARTWINGIKDAAEVLYFYQLLYVVLTLVQPKLYWETLCTVTCYDCAFLHDMLMSSLLVGACFLWGSLVGP